MGCFGFCYLRVRGNYDKQGLMRKERKMGQTIQSGVINNNVTFVKAPKDADIEIGYDRTEIRDGVKLYIKGRYVVATEDVR